MAIEFARTHVITRSAGHTAVKAAAYRAGEKLNDARLGTVVDYSHRKADVGHAEILLPAGADERLLDRETLWSTIELREDLHNRRATAQLALDHIVALPRELPPEQQIELVRSFAEGEFVSRGLVVDLAVHYHSKDNPHAHLLTTTRALEGSAFGLKARALSGKFYSGQKIPDAEQIRHRWAEFQNGYFREHGIDAVVHNNDGQFQAEVHLGPVHAMSLSGIETAKQSDNLSYISAREQAILDRPDIVIERVSDRKSLFTRHDLYRELHALVNEPSVFAGVKAKLDEHPSLILIETPGRDYLTTQAVLETEQWIRAQGELLDRADDQMGISDRALEEVFREYAQLSEEQRAAVEHVVDANRLGIIVGLAGTGKSTVLAAVRTAYEAAGHRVTGLALAGKAAEELQHASGIESRTIASWLFAVKEGREVIATGDVITLDEAGMVNNSTMLEVLKNVEQAGAKLILVGDGEQLQAIRAGCPFRDLSIQYGYTEIGTIRRQQKAWQRQATADLARGRVRSAVQAYQDAGHIHTFEQAAEARAQLVSTYLSDPSTSRIVLAHRRADVDQLNQLIREARVWQGAVHAGRPFRVSTVTASPSQVGYLDFRPGDTVRFSDADRSLGLAKDDTATYLGVDGDCHRVLTDDGREFRLAVDDMPVLEHLHATNTGPLILGVGDRVLFTRNDRQLGVKNGSLGTVLKYTGDQLTVQIDGWEDILSFRYDQYSDLELGYASTIHKAQGMTVDRVFVFGSPTMDKHLGYVALSRHRQHVDVYLANETMRGRAFADVIGRTNRQETVLDFAERHGLELDLSTPTAPSFTTIAHGMEDGDVGSAGTSDIINSYSAITDPVRQALERAEQTLKQAQDEYLADIEQTHQQSVEQLQHALDKANQALEKHAGQKPRSGFLANKRKLDIWRQNRRSLEIDKGNKLRAVKRVQEAFRSREELRRQEAEIWAERRHPDAARLLSTERVKLQAQQLSDRWGRIEKEIALAKETPDHERKLAQLHKELDLVLRQIEKHDGVQKALSPQRQQSFAHTIVDNKKALDNAILREKGRGRER